MRGRPPLTSRAARPTRARAQGAGNGPRAPRRDERGQNHNQHPIRVHLRYERRAPPRPARRVAKMRIPPMSRTCSSRRRRLHQCVGVTPRTRAGDEATATRCCDPSFWTAIRVSPVGVSDSQRYTGSIPLGLGIFSRRRQTDRPCPHHRSLPYLHRLPRHHH